MRPTHARGGLRVNEDRGLEREAEHMGAAALRRRPAPVTAARRPEEEGAPPEPSLPGPPVAQLVTNPVGNFATYDAANLNIIAQNAANNPTQVEVLNSGLQGPASNPPSPGGWAALTQGRQNMLGVHYPPHRTEVGFDLNIDRGYNQPRNYTRMHAVNSWLAVGSNVAGNIFSGRQSFNQRHEDRAEGFAKGFMDDQSWQVTTGNTLAATLNGTDQIGKNAAGLLYYLPAVGANDFPPVFVDNTVVIVGNDGNNYDGLDAAQIAANSLVMEYDVRPTYGLVLANVIANADAAAMVKYNLLTIHHNTDGLTPTAWAALLAPPAGTGPGNTHTETIPQAAGSNLHNAASALVGTYATRLRVAMTIWIWQFDPDALANATDVATNVVPWRQFTIPPVIMNARQPGAKASFSYKNANNKRITVTNLSSFNI